IEAPAVFVGHGVHAPELGHDDLAGVDLRGKIAVAFPDAPEQFDDDTRAYYSSQDVRAEALAARGAIGLTLVPTPAHAARSPWSHQQAGADKPRMALVDEKSGAILDDAPGL